MSILPPHAPLIRQPLFRTGTTRNNPLARGLFLALGAYSGEQAFFDSVSGRTFPFYFNSGWAEQWVPKASAGGLAVKLDNTGHGGTNISIGTAAGEYSPVDGGGATGQEFTYFCGINIAQESGGNYYVLFDGGFYLAPYIRLNPTRYVELVQPGAAILLTSASPVPLNTDSTICVAFKDSNFTIYINGIASASGSGAVGWYKSQCAILDISSNGTTVWAQTLWRRWLQPSEVSAFHANPWQIYAPRLRRLWLGVAAAGNSYSASISEAVSLADSASASAIAVAGITEAITAGESSSSSAALVAARSEPLTLADSPAAVATLGAAITEAITAGESSTWGAAPVSAAISEGVTLAESSSSSSAAVAQASEALTLADSPAAVATLAAAAAEAITLGESTTWGSAPIAASITEAITAGDTSGAILIGQAAAVEALTLADAPSAIATRLAAITESLSLADTYAASVAGIYAAGIVEAITLADFASAVIGGGTFSAPVASGAFDQAGAPITLTMNPRGGGSLTLSRVPPYLGTRRLKP